MSENLFAEPNLKQITVWARGVLQNKDARDVVVALTEAAAQENKHVQAWENYVDLPDRIYVPVRAYAKISSDPIDSRYVYENDAPDIVVLVEETLVKNDKILKGLKEGGILVVNTRRSPEEILNFLVTKGNLGTIVTVDANSMSTAVVTLSGSEGATDATGIGGGISAPIAGAVVKASGIVKLENLESVVKNPAAMKRGYNECRVMKLDKIEPAQPVKEETAWDLLKRMPFAGTVDSPVSENPGMVTGNWKTRRPVIDKEQCTECSTCWIFCPDACITRTDNGMEFNLKYCKGCALCEATCPSGAITMVPELDFKE
ncbi:MAG TPA: 4Fe-4S binding protein [Syntrophomonadaceae bacterium]|nr:4Fe-4S binding protein [Syntrophomonadaceae bacterium]